MSSKLEAKKAKILAKSDEITKLLQNFSQSQAELWWKVSELAKTASRCKAHTEGCYNMVRLHGVWPISRSDLLGLNVNLETGEIGTRHFTPNELLNRITLGQLLTVISQLDAQAVIDSLKKEIEELLGVTL